jgi:hypothetical protein
MGRTVAKSGAKVGGGVVSHLPTTFLSLINIFPKIVRERGKWKNFSGHTIFTNFPIYRINLLTFPVI